MGDVGRGATPGDGEGLSLTGDGDPEGLGLPAAGISDGPWAAAAAKRPGLNS